MSDCDELISEDGSMTCRGCLGILTGVCRGKWRQTEMDARLVAVKRKSEGIEAYLCPVCDEWHNGHAVTNADMLHTRAATIRQYMIDTFGAAWWQDRVLHRWNPDNGFFSRRRSS